MAVQRRRFAAQFKARWRWRPSRDNEPWLLLYPTFAFLGSEVYTKSSVILGAQNMVNENLTANEIAKKILPSLEAAVAIMPDGFYDSSKYTTSGANGDNCLCHPITLGVLFKALSALDKVAHVGIDVHLNRGPDKKYQPDLVGFQKELTHVVYLDFESPNSSDARIPVKDVEPYLRWKQAAGGAAPYIVVTSLPDKEAPKWQLGYTAAGGYNAEHKGKKKDIIKNPFSYWSKAWRVAMEKEKLDLSTVAFINIDVKEVKLWHPSSYG